MTRRLYIHVGPRKTATSTIQRTLASSDSVVLYPKAGLGLGGSGQAHGHHGLVFGFFGEQENREALLESFATECSQSERDIVISAEILENRDIGAFVRALLARVDDVDQVELLFACREHFSRIASLYNHRTRRRNLKERRLPDEFLVECAAEVCYASLVQDLRQTGFPVTALNYHPSADWIDRFMTHVGFARNQIPAIESELVAFGPKMLVVCLAVKEIPSEWQRKSLQRALNRMPDTRAASGFIFGPDAAEFAERQFVADRQFLKDEFGIELVPPPPEARGNGLQIGEDEFADIAAVAKDFGADGQTVVDFARRFVR